MNPYLGERYSSEDMYRDFPYLRPGDRIAIECGGKLYTDTVQSVSYTSGTPAVWPSPTFWQRLRRAITPRRFRKPLEPIRPARGPEMTISTEPVPPVDAARLEASMRIISDAIDNVMRDDSF